jgi:hypothetical protein
MPNPQLTPALAHESDSSSDDDDDDDSDDSSDTALIHSIDSEPEIIYMIEHFVYVRSGVRYSRLGCKTLHFRE